MVRPNHVDGMLGLACAQIPTSQWGECIIIKWWDEAQDSTDLVHGSTAVSDNFRIALEGAEP
ncbi:hypothetical protein N7527_003433 [Penicillium freii]|nr:hypothetical protein N7527_003433 [Penicillium freii]